MTQTRTTDPLSRTGPAPRAPQPQVSPRWKLTLSWPNPGQSLTLPRRNRHRRSDKLSWLL